MIPGAFLLAAKSFVGSWWKAGAGAALMFAPAFMLGECSGAADQRQETAAENTRLALAAERLARASDKLLEARRKQSAETIATDRKALDNATRDIPDQAPSARQRARICNELRRQNRGATDPACTPVPTPVPSSAAR